MSAEWLLSVALIGVGATLVMDGWVALLKRVWAVPSLNYCLVGRWLAHMPGGRIAHRSIVQAAPRPLECEVGWAAHYAIGIAFAAALLWLAPAAWMRQPTLWPALGFGVLTVALPMLVMQPLFGFGWAASRTPNPRQARLRSLMAHASFGVGLYLAASATSLIGIGVR